MKEKYDFGERKVTVKKSDNLLENTELKEQYDFVTEAGGFWGDAVKAGYKLANSSYKNAALKGAGAGAVVGGVGNVAKNMIKRDDDPTKKGIVGSLVSGAAKGAGAGAVVGAGGRFAARTSLGKTGLEKASQNVMKGMNNANKQAFAKELNMTAAGLTGKGGGSKNVGYVMDWRRLGVDSKGNMIRGTQELNKASGLPVKAPPKPPRVSPMTPTGVIPPTT